MLKPIETSINVQSKFVKGPYKHNASPEKNALKECNAPFMAKVYNDPKSASKFVLNK